MQNGSNFARWITFQPVSESNCDPSTRISLLSSGKTLQSAIVAALLLLAACSAQNAASPDRTISTIVSALRAEGVDVKSVETLEQPFFPVPAHVHTANGEDLQLYEFASAADAEQHAAQVDPRGSAIGTTRMSWLAAPHFYRKDRVIAIHLGSSAPVRAALQHVMGAPFAGHD